MTAVAFIAIALLSTIFITTCNHNDNSDNLILTIRMIPSAILISRAFSGYF